MTRWLIQECPGGRMDVLKDGRSMAYDRDDLSEALLYIRGHGWSPGDEVVLEALDGYRSTVRV